MSREMTYCPGKLSYVLYVQGLGNLQINHNTREPLLVGLLFGVNENLLTQHISGPVTSISYCKPVTRVGQRLGLGLGVRVRARARHCHLMT